MLVEDDERLAGIIRKGLEERGFSVEVFHDAESALESIQEKPSGLYVLDVMLPAMDGIALCSQVRTLDPTAGILILTALGSTDDKLRGLYAGADDYLVKPFDFRELAARIDVLTRRNSKMPDDVIFRVGDLEVNASTREVKRGTKRIHLTNREYEVLMCLIKARGSVVSRADLASKIWESHEESRSNIVDVYVNYLRNKIDKGFDIRLIKTVVGMGYTVDA